MKTIKEKAIEIGLKCLKCDALIHVWLEGYIKKKDVLGLIDGRLKVLHKKLAQPNLPNVIQSIISGQINELEELKAKIEG